MQFSSFLNKLQKMFNIFSEEGEEISEQAKVRILLKEVEHPQLQDAVNALRMRATMDGTTFTECANHLSAQVSELPDQQSTRKIAATGSKATPTKRIRGGGSGGNGGKRTGIHMPDGSVWTGFYSDWDQLSKKDRQTVIDTRKKNKAKEGRRQASETNSTPSSAKKFKDIKSQVAELKRTLASIQSKQVSDDDTDDASLAPADNAGDTFGGRQKKKQKRE